MRTGSLIGILLLALAIAGGLALLASDAPDGLEHTLENLALGSGSALNPAPMPDYQAPFIVAPAARRAIAGITGTLAVLGVTLLCGVWLRRSGRSRSASTRTQAS